MRLVLAIIAGIIAGGLVVAAIEGISSLLYPIPDSIDANDRAQLAAHIRTLPFPAYALVVIAWITGAFTASWLGAKIATTRQRLAGMIAGAFILLGVMMNLATLPHPLWMTLVSPPLVIAMIFAGTRLGH